MDDTPHIYSISELNLSIRTLIENKFKNIWIQGEVSNFVKPASGHWYFTLKDENAQVRCAFFRGANQKINFIPEEGMVLTVRATASLYPARGDYQLIVDYAEPAGLGALQQAFEALKRKLAKEGLFEQRHKKNLPTFPKQIGVITSPSGAVIRDILSVLKRRCPAIAVVIYPTLVQGSEAAPQIVKAIECANARQECDVLILARGGGSLEDLWPFNEEKVARAIFDSQIPVVSAVGHEVDVTIADFVADVRAPTPSAAAELLSPPSEALLEGLQQTYLRLLMRMRQILSLKQEQFRWIQTRLRSPKTLLQDASQKVDRCYLDLKRAMQLALQQSTQRLAHVIRSLNMLNPINTLERGYSVTFKQPENKIIRDANDLKKGDRIETRLFSGKVTSEVI